MHTGDQAEGNRNRNRMGVDHCVGHALQELETFNEVRHHGLANPAEGQADNSDAELNAVDDLVQVSMKAQEDASANSTPFDELLNSGVTDGN